MESDDEFDRDPYQYRNGNASDNEEYDQNDYDEKADDDTTRYPWLKSSHMENGDEMDDDGEDNEVYEVDNEAEVVGYIEDDDEDNDEEKDEMKEDDEEMKNAHDANSLSANAKAKAQAAAKKGGQVATSQH